MVSFSKKHTKESGGLFADRDWTFSNGRWAEITAASGFTGIYYVSDLQGVEGEKERRWLLGDAHKLRNKVVVNDEGELEDVDPDNPYEARKNDETSQLFNSLEDAGVSAKILDKIGGEPGGIDGVTAHLVDKPTGRKQKKNGVETQYDQTWLVAELLVESSGGGKKTATGKAAAKPIAVAGKKTSNDDDDDDDDDTDADVDPIEAAAVAMIQNVLSAPKKYIPTYNAKQNGGGLTTAQMRTAALGNAIPKEHKAVSKADVSKLVGKPAVYTKYDGELWSFDADNGVVSSID